MPNQWLKYRECPTDFYRAFFAGFHPGEQCFSKVRISEITIARSMKWWLPGCRTRRSGKRAGVAGACEGKSRLSQADLFSRAGRPSTIASRAPGTKAHDSARPCETDSDRLRGLAWCRDQIRAFLHGCNNVLSGRGQAAMRRRRQNNAQLWRAGSSRNLVQCAAVLLVGSHAEPLSDHG